MGKKVPQKMPPILIVYDSDGEEEGHRRKTECIELGRKVLEIKRPRHIDKLQERWSDFDIFGPAHAGDDDLAIIEREYIIDSEGDEELAGQQTE